LILSILSLARWIFAMMSETVAVQMKGLGLSFQACLSGCYPHPLNVGWFHSPE